MIGMTKRKIDAVKLARSNLEKSKTGLPQKPSRKKVTPQPTHTPGNSLDTPVRKRAKKAQRVFSSRQEALLAAVPDIIMEVDSHKIYRWANSAGLRFFGDDVIGKEASLYFEDDQMVYDKVSPLFKGDEQVIYVENWQRRKDGQKRLLAWWCRTLKDAQGSVIGALSTARDITEHKNAMEALKSERANLYAIFDLSPVAIMILDESTSVLAANKAAIDLCGCDKSLVIHHRPGDAIRCTHSYALGCGYGPKCPLCPLRCGIEGLIAGTSGPIKDAEIEVSINRNGKGQNIWLEVSAADMVIDNKRAICVSLLDITERKRTDMALHTSEDRLKNVIDGAPFGAHQYELRDDGRLVFIGFNASAERILGVKHDAFLGKTIEEAFPGLAYTQIPNAYRKVVTTGIPYTTEQINYDQDGIRGVFDVRCVKIGALLMAAFFEDVTERKKAAKKLAESEGILRDIMESTLSGFWDWNLVDNTEYLSPTFKRMFGYEDHEMENSPEAWQSLVFSDDLPGVFAAFERHVKSHGRERFYNEIRYRHKDGSTVWVICAGRVIEWATDGKPIRMVGCHIDITERKRAEEEQIKLQSQLIQAQKMEAIGRLAGGVAHDFNNLLMGIMGYADLCREDIDADHPIREWLDEIRHGVERSADLTRQLLAFARKQPIAPVVLDLNDAVAAMLKMLRQLIGEDIDFSWHPGLELWPVKLDPGQVGQILVNLCVNARDAIAGVGKVTIETQNVSIDADYCAEYAEATPGSYVMLAVSDDGTGMDKETLAHIFDPFFTTKGVGEGTGLGLPTVYGIVKQNGGFLNVYSESGKGTTFRIYLPRSGGEHSDLGETETIQELPGGNETIMLVEDEKSVRVTTARFLEKLGYTVLTAETPSAALQLAAAHRGPVELLITDIVMPGMSGRDLATKLTETYPRLKCLFISGYTAEVIAHRGILDEGIHFLAKPFTRDNIARKVYAMLKGVPTTSKE
jgi:PAS domain S-box-containing protein